MKIKLTKKQLEEKAISLEEFNKRFTQDELKEIESRKKYLSVLMALKEIRKAKGLSQEEVAKRAKINRVTLTRLESGDSNATVNTLIKIAGAMNMGLDLKIY